jgi:hypothetical protein
MALALFMRSGRSAAMLSGLFVGLAVLTDYGAAPLAATLALAALASDARRERLPALVLGGLGPLVFFAAYHWALFGSPFTLASSFSPAEMIEEQRLFGLFGRINPAAVWGLTVSSTRGVFFFMPVLVLSLYALRFMRSGNPPRDHVVFWWLAVANMLLIFLINTTFNGWHGGFSTGPRYQIIALPFYVLALALVPERRWVRNGLWMLAAISFANMFVAAAISPVAPDAVRGSPLLFCYDRIWRVLRVDLGIDPYPVGGLLSRASLHIYPMYAMRDLPIALDDPLVQRWVSFNLGERLLGLRGTLSLLPALLGSVGIALWATRLAGEQDSGADSRGGDADPSGRDARDT